jgi:hypothetical protein
MLNLIFLHHAELRSYFFREQLRLQIGRFTCAPRIKQPALWVDAHDLEFMTE